MYIADNILGQQWPGSPCLYTRLWCLLYGTMDLLYELGLGLYEVNYPRPSVVGLPSIIANGTAINCLPIHKCIYTVDLYC